jgi:hypothetical protein
MVRFFQNLAHLAENDNLATAHTHTMFFSNFILALLSETRFSKIFLNLVFPELPMVL